MMALIKWFFNSDYLIGLPKGEIMTPEEIWPRNQGPAIIRQETGDQFDIIARMVKKGATGDKIEDFINQIGLEGGPGDFDGVRPLPTKTALILHAFADEVEAAAGCEGWGDETQP